MIRDGLQRLDTADERALFDIQLDNRSLFLDRWRSVFLATLDPGGGEEFAAAAGSAATGRRSWTGRTLGRLGGLPDRAQLPPHGVADGVRAITRPGRARAAAPGATAVRAPHPTRST